MDAVLNISLTSIGIIGTIVVIMKTLIGYLEKDNNNISISKEEIQKIRNLIAHGQIQSSDEILNLIKKLEQKEQNKINKYIISDKEKNDIINSLTERIKEESSSKILEEIHSKVSKEYKQKTKNELIENQYLQTTERLKEELNALSKRSNINLSLGIVTAIIGLFLLGFFIIIKNTSNISGTEEFLIEFVPRISLIILIEIFAYFFLKLYKENLSEIKYFQNEITTIESKYLALNVSLNIDNYEKFKEVIEQLAKTERNFILSKGQSTVDLERAKIEQQASTNIIEKITSIIDKNSKK